MRGAMAKTVVCPYNAFDGIWAAWDLAWFVKKVAPFSVCRSLRRIHNPQQYFSFPTSLRSARLSL